MDSVWLQTRGSDLIKQRGGGGGGDKNHGAGVLVALHLGLFHSFESLVFGCESGLTERWRKKEEMQV